MGRYIGSTQWICNLDSAGSLEYAAGGSCEDGYGFSNPTWRNDIFDPMCDCHILKGNLVPVELVKQYTTESEKETST